MLFFTKPLQLQVPLDPLSKQAALTNLYFDLLFLPAGELSCHFLLILNPNKHSSNLHLNSPSEFTVYSSQTCHSVEQFFFPRIFYLVIGLSKTDCKANRSFLLLRVRGAVCILTFATTTFHYRVEIPISYGNYSS